MRCAASRRGDVRGPGRPLRRRARSESGPARRGRRRGSCRARRRSRRPRSARARRARTARRPCRRSGSRPRPSRRRRRRARPASAPDRSSRRCRGRASGSSVRSSSASPRSVLTSESPSAPAASTARAASAMSQAAGESFAYSGRLGGGAAGGDDLGRALGRLVDVRAGEVELDRLDVLERGARLGVLARPRSRRPRPRAGRRARAARGRVSARKRSRPGFASPIEFSIPASVSAIRTGGFPSRGSGVIVFVTKASSERATSGAVSASRQPEALSSTEHRPFDAEALQLAVDLDRAAVAGAVAARHRRLPGELGVRARARAAPPASAPARTRARRARRSSGQELGDVDRLDADLGVRDERRGLGVPLGAEAEDRRRAAERSERYGSGAIPIPPPTSSGRSTSSSKPLPSGPSTCSSSPRSSAAQRPRPGPIGSIRNASSPAAARQTLIGRGSSRPGASSMKNWPGTPASRPPASTRSSVYGPTCSTPVTLRRSRLMLDPLLEGVRDLLARVRDRVDGEAGAGERRDAGHAGAERRLPDQGAVAAGAASPAAC